MHAQHDTPSPRMAWLTPYLTVRDAVAALDFYEQAFGFERGHVLYGEDGHPLHCELFYQGFVIAMLAPEGAFGSSSLAPASIGQYAPQSFYVYHDDPDRLHERAVAAGATVITAPGDMFWGDRVTVLLDPDGYQWAFARHRQT